MDRTLLNELNRNKNKMNHNQRWLLVLIALCCVTFLRGQTKLTTTENNLRSGDRIVKQQVEYKDPGASGKSLTWDFSMLQPINEDYSLNYFTPDSTRKTLLCGQEHFTRYYYQLKNDSLLATGFENATTMMKYLRPELKMRFPFQYGDTLTSYFAGKGEYCHRMSLKVKGYTRVDADAEGDLKLPDFETIKKALRVHTIRYYTETGKDSTEMQLDTYAWYAEGIRYPVFESVRTSLLSKGAGNGQQPKDTTVFTTSFYYPPALQTSQIESDKAEETVVENIPEGAETVFTEASMQPNPVINNLYINYKLTRRATIWFSVHNNAGVPMTQTSPQVKYEGYNYCTINMSAMMTGTYTVYVHVDDMVMRKVVVKI